MGLRVYECCLQPQHKKMDGVINMSNINEVMLNDLRNVRPRPEINNKDHKLKSYKFPDGFIMVIDTAEQKPLFGRIPPGLAIVSKVLSSNGLRVGDYSIVNYENKIMIERKQLSDLITYIGKDRQSKTIPKLKELQNYEWAGLVIEAPEKEVLSPYFFSSLSVEVVRQSLVSFEVKYGLHIYYAKSRKSAERWILDRLIYYYNMKKKEKGRNK